MEAIIGVIVAFVSSDVGLSVLGAVLTLVVGWIGKEKIREWKVTKIVAAGIPVAYHVVNEIARKTPNKIDDKVAEGLRVLKEYLRAEGVSDEEVKEEHLAKARILFDALHAQEKEARERAAPTVIVTGDFPETVPFAHDIPAKERN